MIGHRRVEPGALPPPVHSQEKFIPWLPPLLQSVRISTLYYQLPVSK
jgi:hypothetical protein